MLRYCPTYESMSWSASASMSGGTKNVNLPLASMRFQSYGTGSVAFAPLVQQTLIANSKAASAVKERFMVPTGLCE